MRTLRVILPLAIVAVVLAACAGGAAAPIRSTVGAPVDGAQAYRSSAGEAPGAEVPPVEGVTGNLVLDAARKDLLIIKTGAMDLQVEVVEDAVETATDAIADLGGYVSASAQSGEKEDLVATLTFRIPADAWESALTTLRSLAIKVMNERTQTQDVTGDVIDLAARIKNLRATEDALQAIMARAEKITDVLAVQSELTKVRAEIESLSAQKEHLQEQAAYSTLAVSFSRKPTPAVELAQERFDPKDEVERATASLVEVLQAAAAAGIWFAIVWLPILLVLGVVGLVVAAIVRRRMPRRGWAGQAPDAGTTPPPA